MKKAQWLSLAALVTAGFITLLGCPTPTAPGGGGGGGTTVPDVVFADSNIKYYIDGTDTRTDEKIKMAQWEGSANIYRVTEDGTLKVVFEGYPQWWGGGAGIVQIPVAGGTEGFFDFTNVVKVKFEIISEIPADKLSFMVQWLGENPNTGGEWKPLLSDYIVDNATDITSWTTVEIDLQDVSNDGRYIIALGSVDSNTNYLPNRVDTGMAILWGGYTGEFAGTLTQGSFYQLKNIQFLDANGNNVNFYSNIQ